MVEGFICEYNKEQGFFCKKGKRVEGLLIKKEKEQGCPGKNAPFFLLPPLENRGGAALRRRPEAGGPGLDGASGGEGKGRGQHGERFPGHGSGGDGPRRPGHGGRRPAGGGGPGPEP